MHSRAQTSTEIDDNVILYRSLLSLILSPEIERRSSRKNRRTMDFANYSDTGAASPHKIVDDMC